MHDVEVLHHLKGRCAETLGHVKGNDTIADLPLIGLWYNPRLAPSHCFALGKIKELYLFDLAAGLFVDY